MQEIESVKTRSAGKEVMHQEHSCRVGGGCEWVQPWLKSQAYLSSSHSTPAYIAQGEFTHVHEGAVYKNAHGTTWKQLDK